MHIVLDLDETLIHTEMNKESPSDFKFVISGLTYYASKRPGLDNFLNFIFGHFKTVSVWTAATEDYANHILKNIMTQTQRDSLLFVKTRNDLHDGTYKPLSVMFSDAKAKKAGMRPHNTIMIDDREDVMSSNCGCGILIQAWKGSKDDIALFQMIIILKIIIDNGFKMGHFDRVLRLSEICQS